LQGHPWQCETDVQTLIVRTLKPAPLWLSTSERWPHRQIEQVAAAHPDFAIFDSFPEAGPVLAPRLLAAFGSQRDRYQSAAEIQQFSGIAPVLVRSGKTAWVNYR
jgi:hypothetical protein